MKRILLLFALIMFLISPVMAGGKKESAPAKTAPLYTGDGGKGKSMTILAPEGAGIVGSAPENGRHANRAGPDGAFRCGGGKPRTSRLTPPQRKPCFGVVRVP